jgi:hypothetical protein
MPNPKIMINTRCWLCRILEDRLDGELATQIESRQEPAYSLEEVKLFLESKSRTRHRKPRKIE